MDFSKRKVRFNLQSLDPREVPAQLVGLPDAVAPEALVARTASADPGPEAVEGLSLNFPKITFATLQGDADPATAGKVQMQDFHFTRVQMQDFHFVMKVNKNSPM